MAFNYAEEKRAMNEASLFTAQLKPCPFCGCLARFIWLSNPGAPKPTGYVVCLHCKVTTHHNSPPAAVVERWNTRIKEVL